MKVDLALPDAVLQAILHADCQVASLPHTLGFSLGMKQTSVPRVARFQRMALSRLSWPIECDATQKGVHTATEGVLLVGYQPCHITGN